MLPEIHHFIARASRQTTSRARDPSFHDNEKRDETKQQTLPGAGQQQDTVGFKEPLFLYAYIQVGLPSLIAALYCLNSAGNQWDMKLYNPLPASTCHVRESEGRVDGFHALGNLKQSQIHVWRESDDCVVC